MARWTKLLPALAVIAASGCGRPVVDSDLAECPVHHRPLRSGTGELHGWWEAREDYRQAANFAFPCANTDFRGPCFVGDPSDLVVRVRYCPACREEQKRWLTEHGLARVP